MYQLRKLFCFATLILPLTLFSLQKEAVIVEENIITQNETKLDCHSSSIVEVSPGKLCAVWKGTPEGKTAEIWISTHENGTWSQPKSLIQNPPLTCWSPVLFKYPNGPLILFYRMGESPRSTVSLYRTSDDGGDTWSTEELLPAGIVGPTKTKPLIDEDGNIIFGSSIEVGNPAVDPYKATACWIEIFSKGYWSKYGPLEIPGTGFGCIEPSLFWDSHKNIKMLCRDRSHYVGSKGWIWMAESKDNGKTWSNLERTDLPNPDSGLDTVSFPNGMVVLIYNHSHTDRFPLSLAVSKDDGDTWEHLLDLDEKSGEFPSVTRDSQGLIHITYAWSAQGEKRKQIKHLVLDTHKILSELK